MSPTHGQLKRGLEFRNVAHSENRLVRHWISITVLHFLDPWCKGGVLLFFFITRGGGRRWQPPRNVHCCSLLEVWRCDDHGAWGDRSFERKLYHVMRRLPQPTRVSCDRDTPTDGSCSATSPVREVTTDPLVMWVWLESLTPLVSNCVICRGSLGVGKRSFHRFFDNGIFIV
jgi:hypothetical protein